jgi:hypothetical protein
MPLNPYEWNVVLVGHWNRAILTPQGIANRLFQLPPETEIGIEVPVDSIGPYRVSHSELVVMVNSVQLIVEATANDFTALQRAMRLAHRAMENLPETPVFAVGFNVRAQGSGDDPQLQPLIDATVLLWDDRFNRVECPISRRDVTWVGDWQGGRVSVNLTRDQNDRQVKVQLNFERTGSREDMANWLARPVEEVKDQIRRIFIEVFQLPEEAFPWIR